MKKWNGLFRGLTKWGKLHKVKRKGAVSLSKSNPADNTQDGGRARWGSREKRQRTRWELVHRWYFSELVPADSRRRTHQVAHRGHRNRHLSDVTALHRARVRCVSILGQLLWIHTHLFDSLKCAFGCVRMREHFMRCSFVRAQTLWQVRSHCSFRPLSLFPSEASQFLNFLFLCISSAHALYLQSQFSRPTHPCAHIWWYICKMYSESTRNQKRHSTHCHVQSCERH